MTRCKRWLAPIVFASFLLQAPVERSAEARTGRGFNDEYVYATTRGLSDMDMNPAFKVTLLPLTVVLDTAFLPFALVAGLVT